MMFEELESRRLLSSATFEFDPPAGTPNPHKVRFDLDVPNVPTGTFLILSNLTTGASTTGTITNDTWSGGASAVVTFPSYSNGVTAGVLPNGNYYGVIVDPAHPQEVILSAEFFVFAGDADHDRDVDVK